MARIRERCEDFEVEEVALFEPTGEGDHLYLWVEKRDLTTERAADLLAKAYEVARRQVGYAGRKDRRAVTRQWFSLPWPSTRAIDRRSVPGAEVLDERRHRHKLRVGQLSGNRFRVVVRDLDAQQRLAARSAAERIEHQGFANRFGRQRFGRDGDNAAAGAAVLRGEHRRPKAQLRFLVSALQAEVFNQALLRRPWPWCEVVEGDVAMRHDSGGCFVVTDPALEAPRASAGEISPTGPLFGSRMMTAGGAVAAHEEAVLLARELPSPEEWRLPPGLRLRGARRPLRQFARDLEVAPCREPQDGIEIRCFLPAGSYLTVLLEAILGEAPKEGVRS